MIRAVLVSVLLAGFVPGASTTKAQSATGDSPSATFTKGIRPILERSCWNCHGSTQTSDLDLRTRESALRGGRLGPAIVPGRAEESRFYRLVAGLDEPAMPMEGDLLDDREIAAVRDWINQGAHWDSGSEPADADALAALANTDLPPGAKEYWAFKLPVARSAPAYAHIDHPIDRFLEETRREHGLSAAPQADPSTLVRRAYLDLIGLLPTPDQTAAFVNDPAPDAWKHLIDELLASPHYGERWGRHWLDVARYADSSGFEQDYDRPNAWRYRDYVIDAFNNDKPFNRFIEEQIAGDELDDATHQTWIATGFLRAGPRVLFREKDNPERRFDYLDDVLATIGRGILGLTVHCARCHDHKFDPILQQDYYRLQASIFGYVETEVPLLSSEKAEAYRAKNAEIDSRAEALRDQITEIEAPYRERLRMERIRERFPENVQVAVLKPASERTAGEELLATQVLRVGVARGKISEALSAEDAARRETLAEALATLEEERPPEPPMAEIATDGDYRFTPDREGDDIVSCPSCRVLPDEPGSFLHEGPGRYEVPPSYFLLRGDPQSPGARMSPGFVQVATYGDPPTEIPRPGGRTSGRRLALAKWLASPDNPLTARVIVNRVWHHHFGRGIVATLDNFGQVGDRPSHPELLDWLAVRFVEGGWSIKNLHRMMLSSQAYRMASAHENATNHANDAENRYLWRFVQRRLEAEIIRDVILSASGSIDLKTGGHPVFPFIPEDILIRQAHGRWDNEPDGPAVWRRSVYVYRRRSLGFPFFETFDLPDQNVTAAARYVSTVPTQALTLLNNPFVLKQAELFAERLEREASPANEDRIDLAYRIALSRQPSTTERAIAMDLLRDRSLVNLTHVLLNLNEFLYLR